jgi:hypothetical protein
VAMRAVYWLTRLFCGSVRMRTKSFSSRLSSSTRMGKRPCSSGMRSLGLATWKAPAAMEDVIGPHQAVPGHHVEPSMMGRRSRWTPPQTSGPCPRSSRRSVQLVEKMMPEFSTRSPGLTPVVESFHLPPTRIRGLGRSSPSALRCAGGAVGALSGRPMPVAERLGRRPGPGPSSIGARPAGRPARAPVPLVAARLASADRHALGRRARARAEGERSSAAWASSRRWLLAHHGGRLGQVPDIDSTSRPT